MKLLLFITYQRSNDREQSKLSVINASSVKDMVITSPLEYFI